mmetsp:Transcript_4908/g.9190  ORF Transcript_4908/g.9190 Transcript_4908/m.9190 type:complete len:289 (+) Transcript_4908:1385-2251(+)
MLLRASRNMSSLTAVAIGAGYRVKIPLPSYGDVWFTISYKDRLEDFVEDIHKEDTLVNIEAPASESSLAQLLRDGKTVEFKLNGEPYRITGSDISVTQYDGALGALVESISSSEITSKAELNQVLRRSLMLSGQQTYGQLATLKTHLSLVNSELQELETLHSYIMKKVRRRTNFICGGGLSVVLTQWGFFNYTIYEVEWLGWDLMEPITYSVGQGSFVLGLLYYLSTKTQYTYLNLMQRYEKNKEVLFSRKYNLDLLRLERLTDERSKLTTQIELLEQQLMYGEDALK